jgi:hypothetical protein
MAPESSSPVPATTGDEARSDDLGRVGSDLAQDQSAAQADRLIGVVQKNKREQFRVALRTFKGVRRADLRVYFSDVNGEHHPTGKGVAAAPDKIVEVIDLLQAAKATAQAEGLIGDLDGGRSS